MSVATLEADLESFLENSGYKVIFTRAPYADCLVFYNETLIAKHDGCFVVPWRSYQRQARWARRRIRDHKKAMRTLGGLI